MKRSLLLTVICLLGQGFVAEGATAQIPFRHIVIDRDCPMQPHCKTVGDINGDGFVDVLAASAFGQGLFWYVYPNWTKHRIDSGDFTTDMQVGDVDKDGDWDVIIPKTDIGLVWYENPRPKGDPPQRCGRCTTLTMREATTWRWVTWMGTGGWTYRAQG